MRSLLGIDWYASRRKRAEMSSPPPPAVAATRDRNYVTRLDETWGAGVDNQEKENEIVPLSKKQKIKAGEILWQSNCAHAFLVQLRVLYIRSQAFCTRIKAGDHSAVETIWKVCNTEL